MTEIFIGILHNEVYQMTKPLQEPRRRNNDPEGAERRNPEPVHGALLQSHPTERLEMANRRVVVQGVARPEHNL